MNITSDQPVGSIRLERFSGQFMNTRQPKSRDDRGLQYRAVQYFNPVVYAVILIAFCTLAALAVVLIGLGEMVPWALASSASCIVMLAIVAALGRTVVTVDTQKLEISSGWLGLVRRSYHLDALDKVRVRLFTSLPGRLAAGGARGVEFYHRGRRCVVGCRRPAPLRQALLRRYALPDVARRVLRRRLHVPLTPQVPGYLGLTGLTVGQCGAA